MKTAAIFSVLALSLTVAGVTYSFLHEDRSPIQVQSPSEPTSFPQSFQAASVNNIPAEALPSESPSPELTDLKTQQDGALSKSNDKDRENSESEKLQDDVHQFAISVTHQLFLRLRSAGIKLDDARPAPPPSDAIYTTEMQSNEADGLFVVAKEYELFHSYLDAFMNVRGYGKIGLQVYFHAPDWKERDEALGDVCKSNNMKPTCLCDFFAITSDISVPCGEALDDKDGKLRRRLLAMLETDLTTALKATPAR